MDSTPALLTACPHCSAQMPATAAFCPGCGVSMMSAGPTAPPPRAVGKVGPVPENIAGTIVYFTFVPAVLFLVLEPYNKNRFVRFHSVQCLLLWAATTLVAVALKLASIVLFLIPSLGALLVSLVAIVVAIGLFIIWGVLAIKAFQGEMFQLPWLGDFAMRQAGGD